MAKVPAFLLIVAIGTVFKFHHLGRGWDPVVVLETLEKKLNGIEEVEGCVL